MPSSVALTTARRGVGPSAAPARLWTTPWQCAQRAPWCDDDAQCCWGCGCNCCAGRAAHWQPLWRPLEGRKEGQRLSITRGARWRVPWSRVSAPSPGPPALLRCRCRSCERESKTSGHAKEHMRERAQSSSSSRTRLRQLCGRAGGEWGSRGGAPEDRAVGLRARARGPSLSASGQQHPCLAGCRPATTRRRRTRLRPLGASPAPGAQRHSRLRGRVLLPAPGHMPPSGLGHAGCPGAAAALQLAGCAAPLVRRALRRVPRPQRGGGHRLPQGLSLGGGGRHRPLLQQRHLSASSGRRRACH